MSTKKEALVNFLTPTGKVRSTLRPTDWFIAEMLENTLVLILQKFVPELI